MITFTYNGINSSDMGVFVEKQPPLATPYMRYSFYNIRGYDGAIAYEAGRNTHQETFSIIVVGLENFDKVRAWLYGDGKFIRSDLPDRYRNVSFIQQTAYSFLSHDDGGIWKADVTIDVLDPYWYSEREITKADIENASFQVNNRGNVPSTPIVRIWSHSSVGTRTVTIQSEFLSFTYTHQPGEQLILIDVDKGRAYLDSIGGKRRDRFLEMEYKNQRIEPGTTSMSVRGDKSNVRLLNVDKWQ